MKKTETEIKQMAFEYYGTDPHSFGCQRDGYLKGYTDCQDQDNWISVESETPKVGELVIAYVNDNVIYITFFTKVLGFKSHSSEKDIVKYWKPLLLPKTK